ncbi:MAG TPA: undecaprenyldiphospho-muramoylpentapeptide beta-N-acetylglucosaminyltransferase [Rhodothermales bacterium]|nr:undecaprenyldiphospho-muramoylpentapeptide beta-N-acetylglucosaminyltransferase [Rhodothermales bacterium]
MKRSPRILFAGGGTGGHVYPAIAIADAVRALEPEAAIAFAGTVDHMEWEAVPKAGYEIHPITVSGFQRKLTIRNVLFPFKLLKGMWQSWDLVGAFDADVAVGTGGYVSGPVLMMANWRRRPTLLQEQNAYAGVTNRLLSKNAAQIHVAFPEAMEAFPKEKCRLSGNPTREELRNIDHAEARAHFEVLEDAALLLVFGGSLGSQALNDAMEKNLAAMLADENVYIIWQTGRRYFQKLHSRVEPHPRLRLLQYIDRMDLAYAAADVALCRAGAITCSELMVTGTPAILVPSPNVAEDHQTKNAMSMAKAGAAVLIPEQQLDDALLQEAPALLQDQSRRDQMTAAAREVARPDAAREIARQVLALAGWDDEDDN